MRTCNTWWCGDVQVGAGHPLKGSVAVSDIGSGRSTTTTVRFCSRLCAALALAQDVHRERSMLLREGTLPQQITFTFNEALNWVNGKLGHVVLSERALTPERVLIACERIEVALDGEKDCISYLDQLQLNAAFTVLHERARELEHRDRAAGTVGHPGYDPEDTDQDSEQELIA